MDPSIKAADQNGRQGGGQSSGRSSVSASLGGAPKSSGPPRRNTEPAGVKPVAQQ
jgi:hypothetical protein